MDNDINFGAKSPQQDFHKCPLQWRLTDMTGHLTPASLHVLFHIWNLVYIPQIYQSFRQTKEANVTFCQGILQFSSQSHVQLGCTGISVSHQECKAWRHPSLHISCKISSLSLYWHCRTLTFLSWWSSPIFQNQRCGQIPQNTISESFFNSHISEWFLYICMVLYLFMCC